MRGVHKDNHMYLASLDIKTAFGVVKPGLIADILAETGVHVVLA